MHLHQYEAYIMLVQRLEPQTTYGMRLTQFDDKQCHQLDVCVLRTYLPLLVVNQSTPRAVVHGPPQFGGMDILKHSALQYKWGLYYFTQTLRWNDITSAQVLAAINGFQILSGLYAK